MKFISLLIVLLLAGFIAKQQLDSSSPSTEHAAIISNEKITVPKVPTAPKDVQKFEKDINKFMLDAADQRAKKLKRL